MGYSFTRGATKADVIKELTTDLNHGVECIAHRSVGSRLWCVYESAVFGRWLTVHLLASQKGCGWGYKSIDEEAGPYVYDCPQALVDMTPEPENGYGWRAKRLEALAAKKVAKQAADIAHPGDTVRLPEGYKPDVFTLVRRGGKTGKGAWLGRADDGRIYRMPAPTVWVPNV